MFDAAQRKCFTTIYDQIFVRFVSSDAYSSVVKATRQKHVTATDFEYFEWLGRGGDGVGSVHTSDSRVGAGRDGRKHTTGHGLTRAG